MSVKNFEVRSLNFSPYTINGVPLWNDANGEFDKIRMNAMNFGSLNLKFDVKQQYTKPKDTPVKVFNKANALYPFNSRRFELDQPDSEFKKMFSVGDGIQINHINYLFVYYAVVLYVDEQVLEVGVNLETGNLLGEGSFYGEVIFRNFAKFKHLEIKYNLTGSSKTFANGFDGGVQALEAEIAPLGVVSTLKPASGFVKNWLFDDYSPKMIFFDEVKDYQINNDYTDEVINYKIEVGGLPIIVPYWREELAENYDEGTSPEEFRGENQLSFIAEIKLWRNTDKDHEPFVYEIEVESDTGWFNENGNGGSTPSVASAPIYTNITKAVPEPALDRVGLNKIEFTISRSAGIFAASDNVSLHLSKKSDFEEYNQSTVNHGFTYLASAITTTANGAIITGGQVGKAEITQITASVINAGTEISVVAYHQNKASSIAELEIGDGYILSAGIWNEANDEFVQYIIDSNVYVQNTDENDLVLLDGGVVFDPDADVQNSLLAGYTSASFWVEDGISFLYALRQTPAQFGEILSMKAALLTVKDGAANGTTDFSDPDNYYIIQEFDIPFSVVANNANGLPIYEGEEKQNFNLKEEDPFKLIKVETLDNTTETITGVYGSLKINWQYWNQLFNVPNEFFNPSDAFNGYNERSSNFSEKPEGAAAGDEFNTKIVLFVDCKNRETDSSTVTAFQIPIKVYNYGEDIHTRTGTDPDDFADFTGSIITEKLDGTDLNGSVLSSEPTVFKVHFVNNGRVSGLQPFWFMNRLEEAEQPSFDIWEISTLQTPASNNPLQPVENEIALKVFPDGFGGYFTECLIDPSKLSAGVGYKLSGRLGFNEDGGGVGFAFSLGFTVGFNS